MSEYKQRVSDEQIEKYSSLDNAFRDSTLRKFALDICDARTELAAANERAEQAEANNIARYEQHLGILEHRDEINNKYNALRDAVKREADKLYTKGHYSSAINLRKLLNLEDKP